MLRLIDLFSGAGGLTLGFTEAFGHNFSPVWANDIDVDASETYNRNFGDHCIPGDIVSLLNNANVRIPQADIVIGGPPCQGFSLLNKNRDNDPRKELWRPYLEVVERSGAKVFVIENVPQLLDSPEYTEIIRTAERMGFMIASGKLCAADYGVSQVRWRAFIIGCRFTNPNIFFPPEKTHYKTKNLSTWRTVRDAIGDLPEPIGTEVRNVDPPLDLHFGRNPTPLSIQRYQIIPEEGMNRFDLQRLAPELTPKCWINKKSGGTDLFGRLWWDKPSVTIRTEFFKPEKGRYLHPVQHRPITHREAARIQSFPDTFQFVGNKTEIAKQIGNAVPPLLASKIANVVHNIFMARNLEVENVEQINVLGVNETQQLTLQL